MNVVNNNNFNLIGLFAAMSIIQFTFKGIVHPLPGMGMGWGGGQVMGNRHEYPWYFFFGGGGGDSSESIGDPNLESSSNLFFFLIITLLK